MKVLFCALGIYSSVGGIQQFNKRVVRCLSELGNEGLLIPSVVALWDGQTNLEECPRNIMFIPCGRRKARMLLNFFRILLKQKPNVILYGHVLLVPLAVIARLLAPRSKQLLFVHGVEAWERARSFRRAIIDHLMHCIASVSTFTAIKMQRAYRLDRRRFAILPNAFDARKNNEGDSAIDIEMLGEYRLLTVSRLADRYKGHDKVILAMEKVLKALPDTHY